MRALSGLLLHPLQPGAFRLLLALVVVVHHFWSIALGSSAVYLFFVLSGYWIERVWEARYLNTRTPYFTYIVSRVWRLGPVMLAANVLAVGFAVMVFDEPLAKLLPQGAARWVVHSALLLGYASQDYLPVVPAWSLDTEMQFYLIAPLLILIAHRIGSVGMLVMCALFTAAAMIAVLPIALLKHLVFFAIGVAAASSDWRPGKAQASAAAVAIAAVLLATALSPLGGILVETNGQSHPYNHHFNAGIALLGVPVALYTVRQPGGRRDRVLGEISYIIYLLHWVAFLWFERVGVRALAPFVAACIALLATGVGSYLLWRFYDRPIDRMRTAWVSGRGRAPADLAIA